MDLAADHVALARLLRRAHEVVLSGCGTPPVLREVVVRSWARCTAAGVDPDRPAPMMLGADEAAARFATHPLATVMPLVRGLLGAVSSEARHLVAISDADGTLLWIDGHPRMLEAALGPHFKPGALAARRRSVRTPSGPRSRSSTRCRSSRPSTSTGSCMAGHAPRRRCATRRRARSSARSTSRAPSATRTPTRSRS